MINNSSRSTNGIISALHLLTHTPAGPRHPAAVGAGVPAAAAGAVNTHRRAQRLGQQNTGRTAPAAGASQHTPHMGRHIHDNTASTHHNSACVLSCAVCCCVLCCDTGPVRSAQARGRYRTLCGCPEAGSSSTRPRAGAGCRTSTSASSSRSHGSTAASQVTTTTSSRRAARRECRSCGGVAAAGEQQRQPCCNTERCSS
jgi:hypothetical protein